MGKKKQRIAELEAKVKQLELAVESLRQVNRNRPFELPNIFGPSTPPMPLYPWLVTSGQSNG